VVARGHSVPFRRVARGGNGTERTVRPLSCDGETRGREPCNARVKDSTETVGAGVEAGAPTASPPFKEAGRSQAQRVVGDGAACVPKGTRHVSHGATLVVEDEEEARDAGGVAQRRPENGHGIEGHNRALVSTLSQGDAPWLSRGVFRPWTG
jgi:hypothetical protein